MVLPLPLFRPRSRRRIPVIITVIPGRSRSQLRRLHQLSQLGLILQPLLFDGLEVGSGSQGGGDVLLPFDLLGLFDGVLELVGGLALFDDALDGLVELFALFAGGD